MERVVQQWNSCHLSGSDKCRRFERIETNIGQMVINYIKDGLTVWILLIYDLYMKPTLLTRHESSEFEESRDGQEMVQACHNTGLPRGRHQYY